MKGQSPALTLAQIIELLGTLCKSWLFFGRDVIRHSGCGNNKHPLSTFILAIFPLSLNAPNSFWHCFQQLQRRCLREKKNLDMLQYVSSGHLGRDRWQVGSCKTLLFITRSPVPVHICLWQGCQNVTFSLDSFSGTQILQPAVEMEIWYSSMEKRDLLLWSLHASHLMCTEVHINVWCPE